jgi:hypothetical protein
MATHEDVIKLVKEWRMQVDENYAKIRDKNDHEIIDQLQESLEGLVEDGDDAVRKLRAWLNQRENLNRNPQIWMFRKWLKNIQYDEEPSKPDFLKHKLCGLCRGTKTLDCMAPYNMRTQEYMFPDDLEPGEDYECSEGWRMEPAWIPCKCSVDTPVSKECRAFREKLIRHTAKLREPYQTGEDVHTRLQRMIRNIKGLSQSMLTEDAKKSKNDEYVEAEDDMYDAWDVPDSEIPF